MLLPEPGELNYGCREKLHEVSNLLSQLLLGVEDNNVSGSTASVLPDRGPDRNEDISRIISTFSPQDFADLWSLANSHHVIARAFPVLHRKMLAQGTIRPIGSIMPS